MAIPDYQTLMLPLLRLIDDGEEHLFSPLVDVLANQFHLSEEEKKQLLPSGGMLTIKSRAGWARTYLKKAGLLEQPSRGNIKLTSRGQSVLDSKPEQIDVKFLQQFPEFLEFVSIRKDDSREVVLELSPPQSTKLTPDEELETAYKILVDGLANEIIQLVKGCSPAFFERLVVELLLAMGYGGTRAEAGRAIGQSGDGGIDGIIDEDRLGLDSIYIQAKRWEGGVGRPEIQKFVGALQGQRAHKGVFITTSDFTREAQDYVKNINNKVVLINGFSLARLMIENNVGVSVAATYAVKKIDSDYFLDD
ncbi:MAG TPA: restriction endonuclease [Methylotenera sp.]|nr:restriction endonuclease [Methylotenera sp.]